MLKEELIEGDGDQILLPQGWPSEWTIEIRIVPSKLGGHYGKERTVN